MYQSHSNTKTTIPKNSLIKQTTWNSKNKILMESRRKFIKYLSNLITEERLEKIDSVLKGRTDYITIALENIFQPHNASAVLRSCDCFGIQNVHIIENSNKYDINPDIVLGSNKWLTLNKHNESANNTLEAINNLKKRGYRIIATTPHSNDTTLDEFDLDNGKFAMFFGTELTGLSETVIENADEFLKIPMYGFTESLNISVSAAITLNHLTHKIRKTDTNWQLAPDRYDEIKLNWLKKTIDRSDIIEQDYIKRISIDAPQ